MNKENRPLFFEIGISQLIKYGEELCGDSILIDNNEKSTNVILSDGLGSGVKANILSTLTSKILSVMLANGCKMDEAVETLVETLPTCSVRKLAYSTFSIGQMYSAGYVNLVEYDNPPVIFLRDNKVKKIEYNVHDIKKKLIKDTMLPVKDGDVLIFISDGEIHAGIGGVWNLGWGWDRIVEFAERITSKSMAAKELASELTNIANRLYGDKPGDDTSVVVVKVRYKRIANILVGPPKDTLHDKLVSEKLLNSHGKKIICGGTTGNIVSKVLNKTIEVDLETLTDGIPPVGKMEGIDLITEGIITISNTLKMLQEDVSYKKLELHKDGVSRLVKELKDADEVNIMIGQAMNPAHQTTNMPAEFGLKTQIMEKIGELLKEQGKQVIIEYY